MSSRRGLPTPQQLEQELAERQRELGLAPPGPQLAPAPAAATVTIAEDPPPPPPPPPPTPPAAEANTTVLSKGGEEELRVRLEAAGLTLGKNGLQLLKPTSRVALEQIEPLPREVRRRMNHRSGSYRHPYPREDGKDTVKTSFNIELEIRKELDVFFARLGPQRRNRWAQQVLIQAARRAERAWKKRLSAGQGGDVGEVDDDGDDGNEGEANPV